MNTSVTSNTQSILMASLGLVGKFPGSLHFLKGICRVKLPSNNAQSLDIPEEDPLTMMVTKMEAEQRLARKKSAIEELTHCEYHDGKIDYKKTGDSPAERCTEALHILTLLTQAIDLRMDQWPLAFDTEAEVLLFLEDLGDSKNSTWRRLEDEMVFALETIHSYGACAACHDDPLATYADAACVLREVKEEFFEKGLRYEVTVSRVIY